MGPLASGEVKRPLIARGVQSIQLYWVTSATFGLLQSWILDYWDMRRRKRSSAIAGKEGPSV